MWQNSHLAPFTHPALKKKAQGLQSPRKWPLEPLLGTGEHRDCSGRDFRCGAKLGEGGALLPLLSVVLQVPSEGAPADVDALLTSAVLPLHSAGAGEKNVFTRSSERPGGGWMRRLAWSSPSPND